MRGRTRKRFRAGAELRPRAGGTLLGGESAETTKTGHDLDRPVHVPDSRYFEDTILVNVESSFTQPGSLLHRWSVSVHVIGPACTGDW